MTPQGWVWLVGALVCWRYFAGAWHRSERGSRNYHPIQAVVVGAFASFGAWPLVLVGLLVVKVCLRWPDAMQTAFIHEPSRDRLERRRRRRQADVEKLERELEIS